jgi:hypothetical protein
MRGEQADPKPVVERNNVETDPVADLIEQWIKVREAKGLTREAALAELTAAASLVSSIAKD